MHADKLNFLFDWMYEHLCKQSTICLLCGNACVRIAKKRKTMATQVAGNLNLRTDQLWIDALGESKLLTCLSVKSNETTDINK